MLTCEDFVVFLPERFNSLSKAALEHVAQGDFKFEKLRGDGDNYILKFYQEFCGNTFQYIASLRRHINKKHNPVSNDNPTASNNSTNSEIGFCYVCNLNVPKINWSHHSLTNLHKQLCSTQINDNLRCKGGQILFLYRSKQKSLHQCKK